MKKYTIISLISVLLALLSTSGGDVGAGSRLVVSAGSADVFSAPADDAGVLWTVGKYHPLEFVNKTGEWYTVKDFRGNVGWMKMKAFQAFSVISKGRHNIYSSPSPDSGILFTLVVGGDGMEIQRMDKQGGWIYAGLDGDMKGWIPESSTAPASFESVVAIKNRCNIRSGPGPDHKVVARTGKGTAYRVIGRRDQWVRVSHPKGYKGWIHASLIW